MTSSASRDAVLLLTHSADFYTVDLVAEALTRRGARPFRLNTERFPASVKLSARLGNDRAAHFITDEGARLSAAEVRAVWARKLWTPQMDADLDERFRAMCVKESVAAFEGFLDSLRDVRWVNDRQRERAAENKQRQLRVATAALEFFEEIGGRMVAKLLRPFSIGMNADTDFVYTSRVSAEDLAAADTLRHSPMVFQKLIPKARELRIAWVDGEAFTGALDASGTSRGQTDWRRAAPEECLWETAELPAEVSNGLRSLMSELGLVFSAVDVICTPEGEHVFLDVNPAGEWGMLERELNLPISDAIAGALIRT